MSVQRRLGSQASVKRQRPEYRERPGAAPPSGASASTSTTYGRAGEYPARQPTHSERPTQPAPERSLPTSDPIDELLRSLTESYYSGDYQQTIDVANRILAQQANNATALEYREKSEDNLIRGIVPDHRIPFEARVAYNRANSLVRAGNYEQASGLYREARELAERDGILTWKDVEQALLDIQDLALARELLADGDRLMANDNWTEALRKYEGALRVVPNDPQAEERLEMIRRIQRDYDQIAVNMNTIGGTLEEQVGQIAGVRTLLSHARQLLPNSQRLAQMQQEMDNKLASIRSQVNDQAQLSLNHAASSTTLDERILLMNAAIKLLELGLELDPSDGTFSELLMRSRNQQADIARAQQSIRRAQALVSQNFDAELAQARQMLAEMVGDFAQDERYRATVNDLFTRYLERADEALQDGSTREAQAWLDTMRDDPFRILGRRADISRIDGVIRGRPQSRTHGDIRYHHHPARLCGRRRLHGAFGAGSDLLPHRHQHPDPHQYTNQYARAHGYLHADRNANSHQHGDQHRHANAILHADQYADTDQYSDSNQHADDHAHFLQYAHADPYVNPRRPRRRKSVARSCLISTR